MEALNIYAKAEITKRGIARIVIMIDLNRKHVGRDYFNKKVPSGEWDENTRRVKGKSENTTLLNSIIENRLQDHKNFFLKREVLELPINEEVIKRYLDTNSSFYDFGNYAADVLKNRKLDNGEHYDPETVRRYTDEINRVAKFDASLKLLQITPEWLFKYKLWMQTQYLKKDKTRMQENGIWKALSFVRMIYKYAVSQKVIKSMEDPFTTFKVGSFEVNMEKIKWLEIEEVDKIEGALTFKEMPPMTRAVGWRFLAMCVSGMRISDAMRFEEYFFNDAGDLEFKTHKNRKYGNKAIIPVTTDRQRRYFQKALEYALPQTDPKNFRTTFNNHLKVLAALSGVRIDIASHTARHTLGGLLVDAGIETKPQMQILGVKSEKTVKIYQHLKMSKLKQEGEKFKGVM